jgi:hypothetical protein
VHAQPIAAQQLIGFSKYFTRFSEMDVQTVHLSADQEKKQINLFFNCHEESIKDVYGSPVDQDASRVSFAQNFFDNAGMPHWSKLEKYLFDFAK